MIFNWEALRIYVRPGGTDMRKQINGLAAIVHDSLQLDPLDGSLYLFLGKDKRRLKILYWDRNGFCMWQKRLEKDRFPWPKDGESARELDREQLTMLLTGIDFWNAHQTLFFGQVG